MDGYALTVCSCPGGPYLGARKAGTPCRCEGCGFITRDQLEAVAVRVKAEALREAADWLDQDETFAPPDKNDGWWRDGWECGIVDACDALRDRAAALDRDRGAA